MCILQMNQKRSILCLRLQRVRSTILSLQLMHFLLSVKIYKHLQMTAYLTLINKPVLPFRKDSGTEHNGPFSDLYAQNAAFPLMSLS